MARIIILDSGPLRDACRRQDNPNVRRLTLWYIQAKANGAIVAVPEIADYEVRRGLILGGATEPATHANATTSPRRTVPPRTTVA